VNAALAREWTVFRLAVQLLTRLPVGTPEWSEDAMRATPRWYPGVGIVIGALSGAAFWAVELFWPGIIAVLIAVGVGLWATGAMHEDGLADCCDALGGHAPKNRALEIMRDSRLGTYAVVGLGLALTLKVAALWSVTGPMMVPAVLVAGHAVSRLAVVGVMASATYVREEGAGRPVSGGPSGIGMALVLAGLSMVPLLAVAGLGPLYFGCLGAGVGLVLTRRIWLRRIGGYTGDCLGATQQVSELGFYLGLLVVL
jgi:adenosylcobinamide-GDP ribazoletransferase